MIHWLEKNKPIVFGALALLSVVGGILVYKRPAAPPPLVITTPVPTAASTLPPPQLTATPQPTATPHPLRVYVSGEVNAPDVYRLPPGSIIKDAIEAAGGPTAQANLDVVNQALELQDQQHIHIPAADQPMPTPPVVEGGAPASAPDTRSQPLSLTPDTSAGVVVNLNTATAAELELLPGIGPAIAQRIIDYRLANGNFTTIEQITNVKGIGPATFEDLKTHITVD
ncbi:MAG: helix-hairpin-helix domain-containing protein [Anaerolineae bacterium]